MTVNDPMSEGLSDKASHDYTLILADLLDGLDEDWLRAILRYHWLRRLEVSRDSIKRALDELMSVPENR